jgi:hypothetical protein
MGKRAVFAAAMVALATLVFAATLTAQVPQLINFQGRLAEPDTGKPYPDAQYGITFRLYDQAEGGKLLWSEQQTVQLVAGVFNVILGNVQPLDSKLFSADVWLTTQVAHDQEMAPRARLCAGPYALNADLLDGLDSTQFVRTTPPVEIKGSVANPNAVLKAENTGTGLGIIGISQSRYGVLGRSSSGGSAVYGEAPGAQSKGVEGWTDSGIGVLGTADDVGTGVKGGSSEGIGVHGVSGTSYGIKGESTGSLGVFGQSVSGVGVEGSSTSGTGVKAASTSGTALDVQGPADVSSDLAVGGQVTANDGLWVNGNTELVGTTDAWYDLYVGGGIYGESGRVDTLRVDGNATVGGTLTTQNLSVTSPFCGRPAYDSGWVSIEQGGHVELTHNLGGTPDNYIVVMDQKSHQQYVNNRHLGGETYMQDFINYDVGAYWQAITTDKIWVYREDDDGLAEQVRIRIWVYQD